MGAAARTKDAQRTDLRFILVPCAAQRGRRGAGGKKRNKKRGEKKKKKTPRKKMRLFSLSD